MSSLMKGKGARVHGKHISNIEGMNGGKINVGKAFKNFGRDMKKGFTKAGDEMKEAAFTVNHALKNDRVAKEITKTFVPELAGELAGHAMDALAGYATGVPQIGDAVKKATNKGVKSGVSMALKTEGYGMRRMKRGNLSPVVEGGRVVRETVENLLTTVDNTKSKKVQNAIAKANAVESLALKPRGDRIDRMAHARSFRKKKGKGFRGYGLYGYNKD
jgi:tRNA threonylcarbamoyladenosine modification (KEOPS) complex Cgi121 subunit